MLSRRNWLLRCSIFANLAVLLYIAAHVMVKSTPGDYSSYDTGSSGRNLASAVESSIGEAVKSDRLIKINNEVSPEKVVLREEVRVFTLDKLKTEDKLERNILDFESNKLDDSLRTNANFSIASYKLDSDGILSSKVNDSIDPNTTDQMNNNESINEDDNNSSVIMQQTATPIVDVVTDETVLDPSTLSKLKELLGCKDKNFESSTRQRGEFWVLYNYVKAEHGPLGCHESVTYTTHGDFTFLDNLVPLLEKWNAPLSLAIHAPGSDLAPTVATIRYFRDCVPGAELVKKWTSFHVFFSAKHIPKQIPNTSKLFDEAFNCTLPPPYLVNSSSLYRYQKKLLYPVNVGRNIARDAALTHFILPSDIELYPSPFLPARFLNLIARDPPALHRKNPRVFPLSIFEVQSNQQVPLNKTNLVSMLLKGKAIPFHKKVCPGCHNVPRSKEWLKEKETRLLDVFHTGKRVGPFIHWEPIFIGTHQDPMYDERLSWEGKSDKMTQAYAMCVMDYDFMILNNAFLVHRPGIKTVTRDVKRAQLTGKTNQLIRKIIFPELKVLYGVKKGCAV